MAGTHSERVQLMVGPGIPVAIVSDQMDSHEVDKANESPGAFNEPAKDQTPETPGRLPPEASREELRRRRLLRKPAVRP
jgi:hypothetical protein